MKDLTIKKINNRLVCIGGVGTMFYQEGFPIGIAAKLLKDMGVELSWYHCIKEMEYQFTSPDRLFSKIQAEIKDAGIEGINVDLAGIKAFIYASYQARQEMIFQFLFGMGTQEYMKQITNSPIH